MPISFVGSTTFAQTFDTSITSASPSGLADDDLLLAAVYARSALTTPSGWTKLLETTPTTSFPAQRTAVFSKNTVSSSDSGTNYTFAQADDGRIGITYTALRGVGSLIDSGSIVINEPGVNAWAITPDSVTATASGQAIVVFVSSWYGSASTATPTPQTSFTLTSGSGFDEYRLAGSYRLVESGQSNSGEFAFNWPDDPSGITHLSAVTLLFSGSVEAISCSVSAASPLGAPSLVGVHAFGSILLDGPLGAPRLLGIQSFASVSAPTPLGAPALLSWRDFTPGLDPFYPQRYVMDLQTPDGLVRVPISSWQATIQSNPTAEEESANYVQCVVPGCARWLEDIAEATGFVISRVGRLADGSIVEYEMAQAPLDATAVDGGATNKTATLSGYAPGLPVAEDDPDALFDRTLTNVRQESIDGANRRARADIDWLLRPGQRAFVQGTPMIVRYINYYVSGTDQSMFVGSQST